LLKETIAVEKLSIKEQTQTENMIRQTIAGNPSSEALIAQIATLRKSNKDLFVVLGCTELSVLADSLDDDNLIDPLAIVVDRIFSYNKDKS
jgi:aspartate/glutamate racemase